MIPFILSALLKAVSAVADLIVPIQQKITAIAGQIGVQSNKLDLILDTQDRIIKQQLAEDRHIDAFEAELQKILAAVTPLPVARLTFVVDLEGQILNFNSGERMKITDSQKFTATLAPTDAKGNPASIDPTKTQWSTDNPALLALSPAADGLTCSVAAVGPVGSAQLQVAATDANDAADTKNGVLTVDVVGGELAGLQINTSAPAQQ